MNWDKFLFNNIKPLTHKVIAKCVYVDDWQKIRKSMLGKSLSFKYKVLGDWLSKNKYSYQSKVQVHNYVNALKRGGLIKKRSI